LDVLEAWLSAGGGGVQWLGEVYSSVPPTKHSQYIMTQLISQGRQLR